MMPGRAANRRAADFDIMTNSAPSNDDVGNAPPIRLAGMTCTACGVVLAEPARYRDDGHRVKGWCLPFCAGLVLPTDAAWQEDAPIPKEIVPYRVREPKRGKRGRAK